MKHELRRPDVAFLTEEYHKHYGTPFDISQILNQLAASKEQKMFLQRFYQKNNQYRDYKQAKPFLSTTRSVFSSWTNIFFDKIAALTGGRVRGAVSGSAAIQEN